jgi:UDP-N-acetylglucosamine--N-acetylmuramyl-(pentapeptide) pyrophosphoryl-undecaprenol N-acetylglucosamine transferase
MPVAILNTDSVPGKANKFLARYADEIYTQFEFSRKFFGPKSNVIVTGCPLRADFLRPDKDRVIKELKLDPAKKILLVTGASSGAKTINMAIGLLFDKLSTFKENWQIVHLSGKTDFESVNSDYINCPLTAKVLDYFDQMADLLACADLVIGRSGAVSVAEYAASGAVSICMPYPYHADNHQRINASQLESAGAAVIVDDKIDARANAVSLWPVLESLMSDSAKLGQMRANAKKIGKSDAAREIAKRILELK